MGCQDHQLEWHQEDGYRWAALHFDSSKVTGFTKMAPEQTGIAKINHVTKAQITENRHLLNGSGVAIGDVDGDGLADVYLCQLDGANALYKNLGGWRFRDISAEAGVACENQFSTGAVFSDVDGDGDLDLLVTAIGGPNACFLNDGTGTFEDFSEQAGIRSETGAMSMALADTDGDGDLDLYIVNNKKKTVKDLYPAAHRSFERTVKRVGDHYEVLPEFQNHYFLEIRDNTVLHRYEVAEPDVYFKNDGAGRFTRILPSDGAFLDEAGKMMPELKEWGLSARFQDVDDDGDPDLYVCNDFESPDRFWINDGTGTFRPIDRLALRSVSASSMGVDFSDLNRDGKVDFFLTEMLSRRHDRRKMQQGPVAPAPQTIGRYDDRPQYMRNSLFLNRGDNTYVEISRYAGVDASEWSWAPLFLDVDLDGYEDLLVVTGHYYDGMDMDAKAKLSATLARQTSRDVSEVFQYPRLELQNFAFRNRGDLTFADFSRHWRFDAVDISHGMASGDLDNDGDLDIVFNSLDSNPGVYRNDATKARLAVRLKGAPPNTQAIGAKIRVLGGPVEQSKEVVCGGTYLSGSDQMYAFAAEQADSALTIEVSWRSGNKSIVSNVVANRIYEIDEMQSAEVSNERDVVESTEPLFEDVSSALSYTHHEAPFDDFQRQPLLPWKLSQPGPALLWADLDGNRREDLVVTSGRGGQAMLFFNKASGDFQKEELLEAADGDQTAIVGWRQDASHYTLLIAISNHENADMPSRLHRIDLQNGRVVAQKVVAECQDAIGSLALSDYDNDGDLDLFAGGRVVPGRYPEPASSFFYKNVNGEFQQDLENSAKLSAFGLVRAAAFSDLDDDGDADLILAVEWGAINVLLNENGQFRNATEAFGLADLRGWWHGIATGDLNNDGQVDIVATNWGLNSKFRASKRYPLKLYADDFDNNGTVDIVQAYYDSVSQKYVPETSLALLGPAMPYLLSRLRSFSQFGAASLEDIFAAQLKKATMRSVTELAHMAFIRQGKTFRAVPLPAQAQFAPAFFCGIADFDNDGNEDVFLSQNFFATNVETARLDGGRALWLQGDGAGGLEAVHGQHSGIKVYGEQRGAAFADLDNDGRLDVAVSQNGADTKLYRNQSSKPGVHVRLIGPPGNQEAIGAKIRLISAGLRGPVREIQAGSGYAAQNSAVQILGRAAEPTGLWVKWPDGTVTEIELAQEQRDVTVSYPQKK